jgi:putative N6-adenine-specific DNA methylase
MELFATCARGLEEILAGELSALYMAGIIVEKGGVRFSGEMPDCRKANLWLRTANRVMLPLTTFTCDSPQSLYDGVRSVAWHEYLTPSMTLSVDCNLRDSALTHSHSTALKAKDAIVDTIRDRFGSRPNIDTTDPDLRVNIHLLKNRCTVSLDSSGTPLDRRGYRTERNEAPLRETLAAAIILATGWDGTTPFSDPLCGSGTLLVEAALIASRRAPGMGRSFGFERWPGFDAEEWKSELEIAKGQALAKLPAQITGSDSDGRTIATARRNAERAGVRDLIALTRHDMADFNPPQGAGVIVCNPPYGERMGEVEALKPFYRQIGDLFKQRCKGNTAWIFTGSQELSKNVGLKATRRIPLWNGPLECRLLKYELY